MQELRDVLKKWLYGLLPVFKNELIGPIFVLAYPIMGFIMHFTYWNFYYNWLSAILFFAYEIGFVLCFADERDVFLSIATGIYALTLLLAFVSDHCFSNLVSLCVYVFVAFFFLKCYLIKTANSQTSYFESVQKDMKNNNSEEIKETSASILATGFCRECGAKLVSGAAFCNMCGAKQSGIETKQETVSMKYADEPNDGNKEDKSDMKGKQSRKSALSIIIAVLIVGGLIYFFYGPGGLKGTYYNYDSEGNRDDYTYIVFMSQGQAHFVEDGMSYDATYKKEGNKVFVTVLWAGETWEFEYEMGKLIGGGGEEWRK